MEVKEFIMFQSRVSEYPIDPVFMNRWSPRSFDQAEMPQSDLLTILEAARWAPSAYNIQPWRFFYSRRNDAHWQGHLDILDDFNKGWAKNASALVYIASDRIITRDDADDKPSQTHSFDTGAAWAQMALQATVSGYSVHAMAIQNVETAVRTLNLPDRFQLEAVVAIGKRASVSLLPEFLQEREMPSSRMTVQELAFEGLYSDDS
ncbi:MAG: nitroreductase [Sneathiella sp.]